VWPLWKQSAASECAMPAMWQRLIRRPEPYLAVVFAVVALAVADCTREPRIQVTSECWVNAVHVYQRFGRPLTNRFIRCRFRPTCSEYSAQAVAKFGTARGLVMTFRRLTSCRAKVPLGTLDPVP
jgi:putative component of membrane protein insertase Oxa1/YidC/SpoIIIJ protein YidD